MGVCLVVALTAAAPAPAATYRFRTTLQVQQTTTWKSFFSFSAALWRDQDLARLRHAIGGDASSEPMSAAELQSEFPGALPGWTVFFEAHPVWAIAVSTPLALAAIIAGIVLWDAIKPR